MRATPGSKDSDAKLPFIAANHEPSFLRVISTQFLFQDEICQVNKSRQSEKLCSLVVSVKTGVHTCAKG